MNREGDDDETTETTTPEGGDPAGNNVIAFPGARVRPVPQPDAATPGAPEATTEAAPADQRPAEEPGMTLDAFERAVRSAVREKLGDSPEGRPQAADELVAQVFSALTGKDAKTALNEVRQRLSEPLVPDEDMSAGDVIDLSAVREARQRAGLESAQKIGGALKDTFSQFLVNLAQRQGNTGQITLDSSFFRQHGTSLLGNLFQGLASALMQQAAPKMPSSLSIPMPPAPPATPTPPAAPAGEGADATPSAPSAASDAPPAGPPQPPEPKQVQVKLDLGSILAGLFRRRDAPPPDPKPE